MLLTKPKYESTEHLIASIKNKELPAFSFLYDQFSSRLYQYILLSIPKKEEAEQILENAFIKVWTEIECYVFDGRFYSWMVLITKTEIAKLLNEKSERQKKVERMLKELFCSNTILNTAPGISA